MDPTGPQPDQRTILVVDDEEDIRVIAEAYLVGAGHHVIAVAGGKEALAALDEAKNEIALVILDRTLDQTLDGMSGEATFEGIRKRKPDLPVILMSGDLGGDALRGFLAPGPKLVLQEKPFTGSELLNRVREVLALERTELDRGD